MSTIRKIKQAARMLNSALADELSEDAREEVYRRITDNTGCDIEDFCNALESLQWLEEVSDDAA